MSPLGDRVRVDKAPLPCQTGQTGSNDKVTKETTSAVGKSFRANLESMSSRFCIADTG